MPLIYRERLITNISHAVFKISNYLLIIIASLAAMLPHISMATQENIITFANFRDTRDLNPHLYSGEMWAQNMLYESLVKITKNGIEPWLAKEWHVSDDGKVYTFILRSDVKFSDGEIFNAHAAKLNLDAVMTNKDRHRWLEMVRLIDAIDVVNDFTLRISLREPYFPFLIEMAVTRPMRFISPKAMIDGGTKKGVKAYIGTGPFVLSEHKTDAYAVFTLNPYYWGEKPKIDKVIMKVIPDHQTRLLALQKGEIDLIYGKNMIDADAFAQYTKNKKFITSMSMPISTRMILLNTTNDILNDVLVRKALQYGINKHEIAEGILNGSEKVADTLLAKNVPYSNIDITPYDYNPKKAIQLLEQAGWKLEKGSSTRIKQGKPLVLTINYDSNTASQKTIAEYMQSEYAELGIELKLHGEEEQAYRDRQKAGKFDIVFNISWGTPYDPQSFLSGMKLPVYGDYLAQQGLPEKKKIDESITNALISTNEAERTQLFHYVLTTLHNEAVYIPLTYERNRAVYTNALGGVEYSVIQYDIPFELMYRK